MEKLTDKGVNSHSELKQKGKQYFDSRDLDSAVVCLMDYLNVAPCDIDALSWLGQIFRDKNEFEKAKGYFKKAITFNANDEIALYGLADVSREEGDYEGSLRFTKEVLLLNKNNGWAHHNLGFLLNRQQDYDGAEEEYKIALKIMPDNISVYDGLAQTLAKKGKIDECIYVCEKALEIDKGAIEIVKNVCGNLIDNGKLEEAEGLIQKFSSKHPNILSLTRQLAEIYLHQNQPDKAAPLYEGLLSKEPDNLKLMKTLADIYNNQGLYSKSLPLHEQLVKKNPHDLSLTRQLAEIYLHQNQPDKAAPLYEGLLSKDNNDITILISLGRVYQHQKKIDLALSCYNKTIEIDKSVCEAYEGIGKICIENNRFSEAEKNFREALKYKPDSAYSFAGLGNVYAHRNRYEEAEHFYIKCKQIDPSVIDPYLGLGGIFLKQGRFDEAITEFSKALEVEPKREEAKKELDWAIREKKRYILVHSSCDRDSTVSEESIREIARPRFCALGVVYRCNFKCKMCHIWKDNGMGELSIQQWKDFILSFKRVADDHCQINFAGGEPFLKKDLTGLIRFVHDEGFITAVCTNAFLIDKEMAKKIGDSGLDTIALSLDTLDEKKHDFLRGTKGSHRKVMDAIGFLRRYAPKTEINILTIILQSNLEDIIPLAEWVQSNDSIKMIHFLALVQPRGDNKSNKWYHNQKDRILWPKDKERLNKNINKLIDMKNGGFPKISNPTSQLVDFKKYYENPDEYIRRQIKCNLGNVFLSVNEKGNATLCEERGPIGNVSEKDIYDIWFSERADRERKMLINCKKNCHQIINCCYEEEKK